MVNPFAERLKQTSDINPFAERLKQGTQPKEIGLGDYAEDVAEQSAQGAGIGALGTIGSILDLFGLQSKETLPGEKEKYNREFDVLEKMQGGERPSTSDLLELSSDDDIAPRYSRLPNMENIKEIGTKSGLVNEPKTPPGRFARRSSEFLGGSVVTGGANLLSPIAAGVVGQGLEELGAPKWAQAAGEIIAALKTGPKSSTRITSKSPEVENAIKDLRKAGFVEKDITLAKSALEERKILKKYASLTPEAENAINAGVKESQNLLQNQIKKGLPGYAEGGLPYLEKQASNVYQTMEDLASTVKIPNKEPVKKAVQGAIDYLEKYPLLDEQKKFVEFMKDGLSKIDKADTAEFMTGFYRNLGKAGNWGNPKQKEHLLGMVRQGIKDTFSESGGEAAKFGKYFEKTNEAWKHWIDSKDLMQTIEKAQTVDGVNFKKLSSLLNDPENHNLAKKVLGPEQLKNIKSISEGSQAIESLLKQIPKSDRGIQSLKALEGIRGLLTGDFKTLGAVITMEGAKRLATDLLINPEKQNLMKRLITAAKNNSHQQAAIISQELLKGYSSQSKEE